MQYITTTELCSLLGPCYEREAIFTVIRLAKTCTEIHIKYTADNINNVSHV